MYKYDKILQWISVEQIPGLHFADWNKSATRNLIGTFRRLIGFPASLAPTLDSPLKHKVVEIEYHSAQAKFDCSVSRNMGLLFRTHQKDHWKIQHSWILSIQILVTQLVSHVSDRAAGTWSSLAFSTEVLSFCARIAEELGILQRSSQHLHSSIRKICKIRHKTWYAKDDKATSWNSQCIQIVPLKAQRLLLV